MSSTASFRFSTAPEPHRVRTREIMVKHPEVRALIGKNPLTMIAVLGLVAAMVVGAYLVKDTSWWIVLIAAYLGGAFVNHALFVMIHECTHHLLFKNKSLNLVAALSPTFHTPYPVPFRLYATILSTMLSRGCTNWMVTYPIIGKQN